MIKKLVHYAFLLSAVFCMLSCLDNDTKLGTLVDNSTITERRNIKPFTSLVVDGSYDVHFFQSDKSVVKLTGTQNEIKNVKLQNRGGQLYISRNHGSLSTGGSNGVDIYVYSPNLISVDMRGCGDFFCKDGLDTDTLRMFMRGTGDVEFGNIVCDDFHLVMYGAGDVDVKELQTVSSHIVLRGTGDVELHERGVAYTSLQLIGCGDADISFERCGTADCRLIGTGDITLKGDLRKLTKTKRGTGSLETKKLKVVGG